VPPTASSSQGRIRFGEFEVDLRTHELLRGGRRIRLQEKSFLLLSRLLESPGQVVTREDLAAALWPKEYFVDAEHGLNTAVRRLREVLGDSAGEARYVETLPKVGYRFLAEVEEIRPEPIPPEPRVEMAASAPGVPALPVPAPSSPAASPGPAPPFRRRVLAATATLLGLALAIVVAVSMRARSSPAGAGATRVAPTSRAAAEAEKLLAHARYLRNHKRIEESMQFLEEALRVDPGNAEALGGLALHQIGTGDYERGRETARRALELDPSSWEAHRALGNLARDLGDYAGAERHYRRAVEANPNDSKSRNRLARHILLYGKLDEAKRLILENQRIDPNDPDVQNIWISYALRSGDYEGTIREARIWLAIWEKQLPDLWARWVREILVLAHLGARRHEEALALCRDLDPVDGLCAALVHGHAGRAAETRAILAALEKGNAEPTRRPADDLALDSAHAEAYILIGDFDRAFEHLDAQVAARRYPALLAVPIFHAIHGDPRWKEFAARLERTFFSGQEGPVPASRSATGSDSPRTAGPALTER
jgi:DNA-binding winged helix-turn-helix (wHTH) protein/Flp pilus assembly protein TadD